LWLLEVLIITLGVIALGGALTAACAAQVSVGVSIRIGPPPLPVYVQPVCPAPGYIWTPGFWAYDPIDGYYWVPGTWVAAPRPGFLWTPGYWGWGGAAFIWHAGYWGPHVGFYGGINYGFGYPGVGFAGGEWRGGAFFYNRSVTNVNVTNVTNVYNRTVVNNFAVNRVSYNGGTGGLGARPTPGELSAEHERHMEATSIQQQHQESARNNRAQFASVNQGRPEVAATGRPGDFKGPGVVHSTRAGGTVNPTAYHPTNPGPNNSVRGPNPGGGGNHQMMIAHSNTPSSHGSGGPPAGKSDFHPAPSSHNPSPDAGGSNHHETQSHDRQPQQHGSKPSGGGGGGQHDKHEPEPHH